MEDNFQVASASVTDRGLSEKRPQNEDSYLEQTRDGIFAVADGVGGAQAGDVASQMAVEILGEAFANKPENADAEDVMRVAIERANSAIYQMSHDLPQLATMATTIVALHLSGNIATIGHVGDSRLYRVDSEGTISQETADHSVVAEEVRAGRMTPEQAAVHPSRNVISRALGAEATVDVDMKTLMVEPNTKFILCSDGITRHINDWELESIIRSDEELGDICQRLKQICYDRGAEDNLTAVVVRVNGGFTAHAGEPVPIYAEELEEETVATARSPFDEVAEPIVLPEPERESPAPIAAPVVTEEEWSDDVLELSPAVEPVAVNEESEEIEPVELEIPEPAEVVEPALVEPVVSPAAPIVSRQNVESVYQGAVQDRQRASGNFFRSFLSSLLFLIIGALAGAAGMYFLFPPQPVEQQPPPAPVLVPKSDNPPLTGFEEGRRLIDADPTKYLEANKAWDPDASAADLYLKGRAFLRLGMYFEAKQALTEAKKRLKPTDTDAATIGTEISLAMAVINSGPASESLRKDLADWANAAPSNTAANSNTANSGNTNQQVNSNH